jgi:osmoprotectant transport system substrate-binding protein
LSFYGECSFAEESELKGPITVASKLGPEGVLLGQMIVLMLRDHGFKVNERLEFGPTDLVRRAIIEGEIDIYPEYTGNGAFFFSDNDPAVWRDAKKGYEMVKKMDLKTNKIVWLKRAPANNTWAIAARKDFAKAKGLKTLEDFASYVKGGGRVKLACSGEFARRADALPAFERVYGLKFAKEQLHIIVGGNTAQTEKAAVEGTDGVNFAMAYGTDGGLASMGLLVLEDTKKVQPVYEPAPIVRKDVLIRYPEIRRILDPVFESIYLLTLQSLNAKIAFEKQMGYIVATAYLREKGFLKE